MCPIVPTLMCGLERSNFSFAIAVLRKCENQKNGCHKTVTDDNAPIIDNAPAFQGHYMPAYRRAFGGGAGWSSVRGSPGKPGGQVHGIPGQVWWTGEDSNLRSPQGAA